MARSRCEVYAVVLTDHVFDTVRSIDMAEFEELLDGGEVIEEMPVEAGVKELVLIIEWTRALHVVVVDDIRKEERVVTVYEPDEERWSADFKVRKR